MTIDPNDLFGLKTFSAVVGVLVKSMRVEGQVVKVNSKEKYLGETT